MSFDQWWLIQDTYFGNPWSSSQEDRAIEDTIENWCKVAYQAGFEEGSDSNE